ncbi:hypothetical protein CPB86DRAFT_568835 [Serendipita vermifera]|nr:hypothetical protein CPB86DRAFT_568835 [Serendipita vermifera]
MHPSRAFRSARVIRNMGHAKTRGARPFSPKQEDEDEMNLRVSTDNVAITLPRVLGPNFRENTEKALETMLSTPGTLYQEIWESYLKLRAFVGKNEGQPIRQEITQAVLRQCTPSWLHLRNAYMQPSTTYGAWQKLRKPLPYENRLRMLLQDMKDAKQTPALEDFNFVLQQMAAVGHVSGSVAVLKEMDLYPEIQPSKTTYKRVLQSCVFLLESPTPPEARPLVLKASTELAFEVVRRMQVAGTEIDTPILELILRVFKEDNNIPACEQILRTLCAFDVHRPDRMPEEFEQRLKEADQRQETLPLPVPVSTSILTTMVNLYGTNGDIPTMLTLFEVLTNPYPLPSNLPSPSSDWWEEEEYDVANPVVQTPLKHRPEYVWEPQRASPNSATFAILLRTLAWAGNRMLCEHYMLLAEEFDRAEASRLRESLDTELIKLQNLSSQSLSDENLQDDSQEAALAPFIPSPRFLITPLMFMPVFVYANRQRIGELMRWIRHHLRQIIKRRQAELEFFEKSYQALPPPSLPLGAVVRLNSQHKPYVDYSGFVEGTEQAKPLDLRRHKELVEASLISFTAMLERADDVVARLRQRTLEKLTRRIWNNKDIYLSEYGNRVTIGREEWERKVRWNLWAGPVTGAALGRESKSLKDQSPLPARWTDERLTNRMKPQEALDSSV